MSLELPSRYETVKFLGKGGMGQVVLARDTVLNRPLAIKTLLPKAEESMRKRFLEEAQINSQLNHPNIVSVHEIGQSGSALYLILELVEGKDLKVLLDRLKNDENYRQELTLRKRLRLFLQICDALSYAGRCGVVHRDLKPANVMVGDKEQRVLVMDWGLAKVMGCNTDSEIRSSARESGDDALMTEFGTIMGTPAYMSPEQALNSADVDHRSDVYALGAILYELIALAPPYQGPVTHILRSLTKGAPVSVTEVSQEGPVHPALVAIIEAAMNRDVEDRTQDAAHLARQIRDFLDQRPVDVYQEALLERLSRLKSRYRGLLIALAVGAVVMSVFMLMGLMQLQRNQADIDRTLKRVQAAEQDAQTANNRVLIARQLTILTKTLSDLESRIFRFLQASIQAIDLITLKSQWKELTAELEIQKDKAQKLSQSVEVVASETPSRRDEQEQIAGLISRTNQLRSQLDDAMADTFLARAPNQFLEESQSLKLESKKSLYKARALLRLGETLKARRLLSLPQNASEETVLRSLIYSLAHEEKAEKQLKLASAALQAVLVQEESFGLNSEVAWLLGCRAEIYLRLGRRQEAQRDFKKSLSLRPLDMWIQLSFLEAFNSPYTRAYVLNLVFDFDGSLSQGLWRKGEIYNKLVFEFPKTLAETLEPALNERCDATLPVLTLALRRNTDFKRTALAEFLAQKLLALDPKNPKALVTMAELVWKPLERRLENLEGMLRRLEGEIKDVEKSIAKQQSKDPKIALGPNHKLSRLLRAQRFVETLIRQAIEAEGKARPKLNPDARQKKALLLIEEALKQAPENPDVHGLRGRIALENNDLDKAIESFIFESRVAIWPNPYKRLAEACLRRGRKEDLERGAKAVQRALCLDGYAWFPRYKSHKDHVHGDPALHKLMGQIRLAQGLFGQALLHSLRGEVQATRIFSMEKAKLAKDDMAYQRGKKNKKTKADALKRLETLRQRQEQRFIEQGRRLGEQRMVVAQCFLKLEMPKEAAEMYRRIQAEKLPQAAMAKKALETLKK